MLNILRADINKAVRSKLFWVILGLTVASEIMVSYSSFSIYSLAATTNDPNLIPPGGFHSFVEIVIRTLPDTGVLVGIFAILFAMYEFSHGTIKNISSKGYHREYIYLSKFVTALGVAVFSMALQVVISFVMAKIIVKNAIPNFFDDNIGFAKNLGFFSLQIIAYIALALFLVFVIRSLGPALSIFIVYYFLQQIIPLTFDDMLQKTFHTKLSLEPYMISNAFYSSMDLLGIADVSLTPDQVTRGIIVLCTYILVFTIVGIYTFRKRDIN